jgi:putative sigma-54 modulation protein
MNINFNFKNFEPSEHLRQYARRRFEKLSKYIPNSNTSELQVNLSVEKFRHKADVVLNGDNLNVSAQESSEDMYSTVDMVLDKLEVQVKKLREKNKDRRRQVGDKSVRMEYISFSSADGGERQRTIVGTDSYEPKPMDVDEAAMQLDNLNYEFLVFRNAETDRVNVIYLRKNGDFGLIDPGT